MMRQDVQITTTESGLTVIGEVNQRASSAGIGIFVKTGARDELPHEAGVSHFLEHMVFKGTATRSALDITYQMGNIGAQANAFTSEEHTVFYSAILPEYFSDMHELLADMIRPSLTEADFDTEKGVILEEIALYQDRPHHFLIENALRDYFAGNSAGNSVLGTTESITALSHEDMRRYWERRYVPANMILAASGNFDWDKLLVQVNELYPAGPQSSQAGARKYQDFKGMHKAVKLQKPGLHQTHVLLICDSCSSQAEERYALAVLSVILGDSSGSKLYWELVDSGLAEGAGAEIDGRDQMGLFMAYASTEAENLEEVSSKLYAVLKDPLAFSDADLERGKRKVAVRLALDSETPMGRLMSLGLEWSYRKSVTPVSKTIARIQAISRQEIADALKKYPIDTMSEYRLTA